jgi:hypothetical protein
MTKMPFARSPRPRGRVLRGCIALAALAVVSAACGSGGDTGTGSFTIDFPSTDIAIETLKSTSGVQVFVYRTTALGGGDAGASGACQNLVEDSLSNTLPTMDVAKSALVSPCDLMEGKGSLPVAFGSYAFLAVAQSSPNKDFLVGCAEQTISATNTVVTIPMTLAAAMTPVPTTKCTTLAQACPSGNGC